VNLLQSSFKVKMLPFKLFKTSWSFKYELIKPLSFIIWTGSLRFQYFFSLKQPYDHAYSYLNNWDSTSKNWKNSTRENDTFACEIHKHACRFWNIFLVIHIQFFRTHARVWFQHARLWCKNTECDFHTLVCLFSRMSVIGHAWVCFLHADCDFHTQSLISTRTTVISILKSVT
jgi:hypothetical protein